MAATYERCTTTDDGCGFKYENKMTAFVALRLYSNTDEFHLANNLNSGEKFDDIVFTYKADNRWNTYFVQLKHKQTPSLLKKKLTIATLQYKGADFAISKYFDSYKKIYRKLKLQSNDVIFQRGPIGARFVLFTNAFLHDEIAKRGLKKIDCGILSTHQPDELNVSFDAERDVDILSGIVGEPMCREFVSKFYFCSGQASENEMDQAIEKEVKKIMQETTGEAQHWSDSDLKNISMKFCAVMFSWYTKGKYLTKEDVKSILFDISVASQCGKKNATALKFTPSFCNLITNVLKQDTVICLESQAENSIMCIALLRQLGLLDEPNKLMELKQLQIGQFQEHLLGVKNPQSTTVVIDCDCDTLGIKKDELISFFLRLFAAQPKLQVLFVTVVGNQAAMALIDELKVKKRKFNCTLIQLVEESKRSIMGSEVIFQGCKTPLNLLLASPNSRVFDDVINMASMTQLLQGRSVEVGVRPIEQIPYYVPRVLTRFATIAPTVFSDPRIDACFALSGINTDEAGSTQIGSEKYFILEGDEEKMFEELAKTCKKPLHWLAKKKKAWCWKRSTRNLNDLSGHVERSSRCCEYLPTDNIMQIKDQIVVVIAEPGMGKSTLITQLAVQTKQRNPEMWIISLALNDFTAQFDDPQFLKDVKQSTRNLIAQAAGVLGKEASKLNLRLFNQCYDVSGNMIILLDGFDEITPYYTEHGLAMIKVLQETAVSRVWVTARPVLFHLLENETCCFSYSIKPFETKDQINFFKKFWSHKFPEIGAQKLEAYIKRVLETIAKSFDEKMDQFTGVPLQTRMLAEVFQAGLKTYHETGELVLKDRINGVELFEEFVRIKRGIQMDKAKITATNAIARFEQKRLDDVREKELMRLALLTLLPRKTCAGLHPPITEAVVQQLKEVVQEGNEKSGIVVSFGGETPQFIHRTFAEYFVALFFTKNYKGNRNFLLSDTFSSKNFEFVKYFLDRILCAGLKLHEAVLDRQYEELERIVAENMDAVDKKDVGGRTAMHVAATMSDNERAIRVLLQAGAGVDIVDDILELPALEHAIRHRHVGNIAALYENSGIPTLPPNAVPVNWESLRISVSGDYFHLFKYLMNNGVSSVEDLDKLSPQKWLDYEEDVQSGMTILHLASAYNAVKILENLLKTRDIGLLDAVDSQGRTPMALAGARGHSEAITCLLDAGAKTETHSGKSLLELAVEQKNLKLLTTAMEAADALSPENWRAAVAKLIADKSDWSTLALNLFLIVCPTLVNFSTIKGLPLIAFAALKNNPIVVGKLRELDADVNSGFPLHIAVSKGFHEVVDELLKSPRIDVNAYNAEGVTPVYLAARVGSPQLVDKLVNAGADIHSVMTDGSNLTHAVGHSCNESLFFYLLASGFDFWKGNDKEETGLLLLIRNGAISLIHVLDPLYEDENFPQQDEHIETLPEPELDVPQPAPRTLLRNAMKNQKVPKEAPPTSAVVNDADDFVVIDKNLCDDRSDFTDKMTKSFVETSDFRTGKNFSQGNNSAAARPARPSPKKGSGFHQQRQTFPNTQFVRNDLGMRQPPPLMAHPPIRVQYNVLPPYHQSNPMTNTPNGVQYNVLPPYHQPNVMPNPRPFQNTQPQYPSHQRAQMTRPARPPGPFQQNFRPQHPRPQQPRKKTPNQNNWPQQGVSHANATRHQAQKRNTQNKSNKVQHQPRRQHKKDDDLCVVS